MWEQAKGAGSFPWGKAGAALKPLHDAGHSGETIAGHLERYIPTAGEFVSFVRFRETFADYAPVALTGPAVVDGWMSDEVERLTRPAAAGGGR